MKYLPKGKEIPNGYMLFRQAMEDGVFTKDEFLDFFTLKKKKNIKINGINLKNYLKW